MNDMFFLNSGFLVILISVGGRGSHTFDVSVDLLLGVQVVETLQDLLQHGGDLGLIKWTCP